MDATGLLHRDRSFLLTRADFPTQHQGVFDAYLAAAQALADGSKAAKGASPKKPTPNVPDNALTQHNALLKAADDARKLLRDTINAHGCKILLAGCFAAGTKLLTREGWRAVETLREGDEVATRPEHDVYASVSFRPIEEVFIRTGRVLHLHLSDGQLIRTTPEHPFWVEHEGWTPADMLRAGMRLATLAGEWVGVEEAYDTGEYETVYNCRVAEHHTYFVGDETHVLAVWAHNTYFVGGRKVADDLQVELTKVGATLSAVDRAQIVEKISKPPEAEGEYGRVGNYPALVAWLVRQLRPANGSQPPHASLEASLTAYFQQGTVDTERKKLNGYIRDDKGPDGKDFIKRVIAPAIINTNDPNDPANRPEVRTDGWMSYIQSFNHTGSYEFSPGQFQTYQNADVTDRSYRKAEDDLAALVVSVAKPEMHGHHIIFKKGNGGTQRKLAQDAKDMVLRFGVNPFWDAACLAYAPNWGHNAVVLGEIKKRIEGKYNSWLGDLSTAQAEIKKLMAQIALDWCKRSPTLGFKP